MTLEIDYEESNTDDETPKPAVRNDPLTVISGVNNFIESQLLELGIDSIRELATSTVSEVQEAEIDNTLAQQIISNAREYIKK